jgi:phosphoglycolate phosphatase-like HAD superfamily hydrolase
MDAGKLDLAKIQAIFFDVDGTLRDTDDQYVARFNRFLSPLRFLFPQRNSLPTARKLVMAFEDPVNDLFGLADRVGLDGPLHKLVELLGSRRDTDYLLVPGIEPALRTLAARFPMAIITVRGANGTRKFLEGSQLAGYFKCVASGQTVRRTKPFPDQLLWAADALSVNAQNCVMVGDTTVDMLAGKAAGAQTIGVLSGFGDEAELKAAGADVILPSVADLPKLFDLA